MKSFRQINEQKAALIAEYPVMAQPIRDKIHELVKGAARKHGRMDYMTYPDMDIWAPKTEDATKEFGALKKELEDALKKYGCHVYYE